MINLIKWVPFILFAILWIAIQAEGIQETTYKGKKETDKELD